MVEVRASRKVRVWKRAKVEEVEAYCRHCGSRHGEIVYGSIHVYFFCYRCNRWSDLGYKA